MSGLETPEDVAARTGWARGPGSTVELDNCRMAFLLGISADRPVIGQAILTALRSPDSLELLRALAEDLGAKEPPCSRCGDALGPEERDGTCAEEVSRG